MENLWVCDVKLAQTWRLIIDGTAPEAGAEETAHRLEAHRREIGRARWSGVVRKHCRHWTLGQVRTTDAATSAVVSLACSEPCLDVSRPRIGAACGAGTGLRRLACEAVQRKRHPENGTASQSGAIERQTARIRRPALCAPPGLFFFAAPPDKQAQGGQPKAQQTDLTRLGYCGPADQRGRSRNRIVADVGWIR